MSGTSVRGMENYVKSAEDPENGNLDTQVDKGRMLTDVPRTCAWSVSLECGVTALLTGHPGLRTRYIPGQLLT